MRHGRPIVPVILLLAPLFMGVADGSEPGARYLVGYAPGDERAAHLAIQQAGGLVRRTVAELGLAVVETDVAGFERALRLSGAVRYVERDDPVQPAGTQWSGTQWNGAQWNGAQWNGAQWNGALWAGSQWNGVGADGSQWNGAQWNALQWTVRQFRDPSWPYDLRTADPGLLWQWGAWAVKLPEAWKRSTGTRTATLCVLDSGVAWDHPDLAANAWTGPNGERGYNAIDPRASAYDDAGHGTHVAGVAAAVVGNALGVAGAGNVRVIPVKVLDASGRGRESDLAAGLVWCADRGADVALMALSATEPGPSLDRAIGYAADRDVLLVASAGNGGTCADCVAYPARDPRVVAVSAVDGSLALAPFSSQGLQVELAAPGVHVLGPYAGGAYMFGSGTSQAAAFVAGAAALARDASPQLSASSARDLLRATARDLGPGGHDAAFGHGLLNADAALALAISGWRR